ncbi:7826_t:CDS:2 [Ambispora leptoticha]|uniref:Nucleoside diphosphate kinase n=1 Tax=Ambispora leptoticha TaxID=144679 RepID=A0A9N9C6R8_9GLOM|nr:7826_t:CDS:2 [Ambispora leptoticha]
MLLPRRQLTLALLKPDLCANPNTISKIISRITATNQHNNFEIIRQREILWRQQDAEAFYAEHRGRFFFERLCGYMTSGPFMALVLARQDAIKEWRALIGPTHPWRARINAPNTLRSLYGLTDTRNSFHGSDSDETAKREIEFFFPELDVDAWRRQEEK